MKIRIFKSNFGLLKCDAPGKFSDVASIGPFIHSRSRKEVIAIFGETMPEIVIDCELNPNDKYDSTCLKTIEMTKSVFEDFYNKF